MTYCSRSIFGILIAYECIGPSIIIVISGMDSLQIFSTEILIESVRFTQGTTCIVIY